jgi:thymidylate synthase ThyX
MLDSATIITDEPIIEVLAEMDLNTTGVMNMARWVERYRPECVPQGGFLAPLDLVPHDGYDVGIDGKARPISANEMLAELAGRKCYDSFAEQAKPRKNGEYLRSMWEGRVPHRSTGYHAKMTFFFAHISRRVSHELIRNYVGSDRDEEGSPSQESTRFTHHPGVYVAHPYLLDKPEELAAFTAEASRNYDFYRLAVQRRINAHVEKHGAEPKGLARKRIYESTAGELLMSCGTSFIWTTNPMAMSKFFHERDDEHADMEIARFARAWKKIALERWPNLFPDFKE